MKTSENRLSKECVENLVSTFDVCEVLCVLAGAVLSSQCMKVFELKLRNVLEQDSPCSAAERPFDHLGAFSAAPLRLSAPVP